jgi:hypothetical protein
MMKKALLGFLAALLLTGAVMTSHKMQGAGCPFCRFGSKIASFCK